MVFIEYLKDIIPPSIAKNLHSFEIKLNSQPVTTDKKYRLDKLKSTVIINLSNLSPKEKRNLKKGIKNCFDASGVILIEEQSLDLLHRLYQYNDREDERILSFFKPILAKLDWEALRDSLFLRNQFKKQFSVGQFKNDIKARYGERGNTICNLCTAGYFEQTMIPLFKSGEVEFWKYWDIAVQRGITALFVNSGMNVSKITSEIKQRISSAKSYGLPKIHIHGIGDKNIKKIKECIETQKENLGFLDKNIFTDDNLHVIIIEIIL